MISFRIDGGELQQLESLAREAGYRRLSHFVRHVTCGVLRYDRLYQERGATLQLEELIRIRKLIRDFKGDLRRANRIARDGDSAFFWERADTVVKEIELWSEKFINP